MACCHHSLSLQNAGVPIMRQIYGEDIQIGIWTYKQVNIKKCPSFKLLYCFKYLSFSFEVSYAEVSNGIKMFLLVPTRNNFLSEHKAEGFWVLHYCWHHKNLFRLNLAGQKLCKVLWRTFPSSKSSFSKKKNQTSNEAAELCTTNNKQTTITETT